MKKAVAILLCLAVFAGLSALPRLSYVCDGMPDVLLAHPCCPKEQPPEQPTWNTLCCEAVSSAAIVAPCTPLASRLLEEAPPAVAIAVVLAPFPHSLVVRPRHPHSAIPPGSGLRLLNTTVLRI